MSEELWIEWAGGECPLPVGAVSRVRYRDGVYGAPSRYHEWAHDPEDPDSDIVAYQVLSGFDLPTPPSKGSDHGE